MSEHRIKLQWRRTTSDFQYKTYNRAHTVTFKNGQALSMSSAVAYRGDAELVDPEEMFVASLSSCHMLTFLALAANRGFIVEQYIDDAVGVLAKNAAGKLAITQVTLHPRITFAKGTAPNDSQLHELHDKAHHECFIANSVVTPVTVETPLAAAPA